MAFFADLTTQSYSKTGGLRVLNIGWLDKGRPYAKGSTFGAFRDLLRELCEHPIRLQRSLHICGFCGHDPRTFQDLEGDARRAGNGQIQICDQQGIWYTAPSLVYHYVTKHEYCPPIEFVEAVLAPSAVRSEDGWQPASLAIKPGPVVASPVKQRREILKPLAK